MSLFKKMKRAFGVQDFDDSQMTEDKVSASPKDEEKQASQLSAAKTVVTDSTVLSAEIFSAVVELFNKIQPEFVRKCLNTEEQQKYILDSIDAGVRKSLESAQIEAQRRIESEFEEEKRELSAQVEKLKAQHNLLQEQRNNFQAEQLSATRQKRALTERIHDLETIVDTLTAEKEQFELESRSMQNKLRVMSLNLSSESPDSSQVEKMTELAEENSILKQKIATLQTEVLAQQEKNEELTDIELRLKKTREERDRLQADLNSLKMNLDYAEKSERRTQSELATANEALEELQKKYDDTKGVAKDLDLLKIKFDEKERLITDLRDTNRTLEDRVLSLEHVDYENKQFSGQIKELNATHADELQNVKSLAEEEITKLKNQLESKDAELSAVRASLAENLALQQADKAKRGRKPKAEKEKKEPAVKTPTKKNTPKISAIDEFIDESEWLIAPSPNDKQAHTLTSEPDDDFGYKAPPKKVKMADDAKQLRLF